MKTLFYPQFERLEIAEQSIPEPGLGEALLRVEACGICGSELESFKNKSPRRPPPLVMGHEFCGVIEKLGEGVEGRVIGERVVSNAIVPCEACAVCRGGAPHLCPQRQLFGMHRPGAFAQWVAVPARCLLAWPETLPASAACLAEPVANGVHMVRLTQHLPARRVFVIGAGPIGLMAQQAFAALRGSEIVVADLSPERLEVARRLGAVRTFNGREDDVLAGIAAWSDGEGADLVIDAVGAALTKTQSIEALRPGGAAVWIGLQHNAMQLDSYALTLAEKQVIGSYGATMDDMQTALELMASGKVETESWVQTFSIERGVEAFERALAGRGGDIKVVVLPNSD